MAPSAAGRLLSVLQGHPELMLAGLEPQGTTEVRWADGGLQVRRSSLPGTTDWHELREEIPDPRVDRKALAHVLAAGSPPGALCEERRRELETAAFLGRLLDLLASCGTPCILECAAGRAPLALALLASLARFGRRADLILLDEAEQAIEAARILARQLGLTAEFLTMPLSVYEPQVTPDLLFAVHACGRASVEVLALGLELGVPRLVLVPCCPPEGSGPAAGFSYGEAGDDPLLRTRLDAIGLILDSARQLRQAGYETRTFEAYLRPWRTVEVGLAAYLPPP